MNAVTKRTWFDLVCEVVLFTFMSAIIAFGPDNSRVFIPAEVIFVGVFGIRFLVKRSKFTIYTVWSLGFVALAFLSVTYATNRSMALERAFPVIQVLVFGNLIVPYISESEKNYRLFLHFLIGAAFILLGHLVISTSLEEYSQIRLGFTIGINPNSVGLMLAVIGLVSLYLGIQEKKISYWGIAAVFFFISLFSGSRKVLAVLGIGIILLVFLTQKTYIRSFISLGIAFLGMLAVLILAMTWDPLYQILGNRIETFLGFFTGKETDLSMTLRSGMIQRGWEMFLQKPFLGWGLGSFTDVSGFGMYAHNNYIELLVAFGLLGTFWYYALPFAIFGKGVKLYFSDRNRRSTVLSLTIISILLIDDIGRVRYISEFDQIIYGLCFAGIARQDEKAGIDLPHLWKKMKEWFGNPRGVVLHLLKWRISRILSDKVFLSIKYRMGLQKKLSFTSPQRYNEKLQWLKVNDHNPMYPRLVDKYMVRAHISNTIGDKYLIPLIGVFDSVDEIVFSSLPNEFVLKPTHTSGDVLICRDKNNLDWEKAKHEMQQWLKKNYYWYDREWPYKEVKPRLVCEQLIQTEDGKSPRDYKIFCFNGEPKLAFVASDRGTKTKFDFFDLDWNKLPMQQHYPNSNYSITKPAKWEEMLSLSRKLSAGMIHVRVDFYVDVNDEILFGELTFYHFSGFEAFFPDSYDLLLGNMLTLPEVSC